MRSSGFGQRPQSATDLKPRSLVVPRGHWQSKSSPALAAAFNLRKYAVEVRHIPGERPASAPAGMANQAEPIDPKTLTKIDLLGGNGKWRQIQAEAEFKRRKRAEEERRKLEKEREAEKKRRLAEQAERKRRHQEQEEQRWLQEQKQKEAELAEQERLRLEKEEKARLQRELEEEERRRRMPKTCETCDGSTKCQDCMGKGYIFSVFLVHKVAREDDVGQTNIEHGRKEQGCEKCGGYAHNQLGDLKKGTGLCPVCQGLGKVWPVLDEVASPKKPGDSRGWFADRTQEIKV